MDLYTLHPTTHAPEDLVEGYSSLIWTERHSPFHEFVLKTAMVEETLVVLAKNTLVGIADSEEVLMVETHSVTTDEDTEAEELTVTGRSFLAILESRAIVFNDDPISASYFESAPGVFLANLINTKIASTTVPGVLQADIPAEGILHSYARDLSAPYTTIPDQPFPDPTPGDTASLVTSTLNQYGLGIRARRPLGNSEDIVVEIYVGRDLTEEVQFNFEIGDITNYSYVNSNKDYKNVAYVRAPIGFKMVYGVGVPSNVNGLDRRVLQVDATDLTDEGNLTVDQALTQRGLAELAKYNGVSLLDGEISEESQYQFNVDYALGDVISLLGKEGVANSRRVTEYVRSEDDDGEKAYPTLAEVEM